MKKIVSCILCFLVCITPFASVTADSLTESAAEYIICQTPNPTVGSVGGEWAVFGLARSNTVAPVVYENYLRNVTQTVKTVKGVLHEKKYTEYARVCLALTALGKDPQNIAGYNLLKPLGDFKKTVWQGVNGAIWALIALDSGKYNIPQNDSAAVLATRQMYVDHILANVTDDGGWNIGQNTADADLTAMALCALFPYREQVAVNAAIEQGISLLANMQTENGGYTSSGTENAESCAQVVVAMCTLGISFNDPRFVKNGHTVLAAMCDYATSDGGFYHTAQDKQANGMATEQCFYALAAVKRAEEGKTSLYDMTDILQSAEDEESFGLSQKHPDITKVPVKNQGKTFSDIENHPQKNAIDALCARGILNGKSDTAFAPHDFLTRAEFAAVVARSLGLPQQAANGFSDVTEAEWFFSAVNTASSYGIIQGVGDGKFLPFGTVTRSEAAVMIARAAELAGFSVSENTENVQNTLSQFTDYRTAPVWAQAPLAFCVENGILADDLMELNPNAPIDRGEIAGMLYQMLDTACLL